MTTTLYIVLASLISTAIGVGAASILYFNEKIARKMTIILISFAVGTMLAAVFFDLLPEALEKVGDRALPLTLLGILLFFVLEKVLLVYHCHENPESHHHHLHAARSLVLFGDFAHNLLDGIIIATTFLVSVPVGIVATIAIIAHEVPQEIGDFSILIHSGMARARALMWNMFSGLGSLVGAVAIILFSERIVGAAEYLLPISAGGFLYIAAADLMPEIHDDVRGWHSFVHVIAVAVGIITMIAVSRIFGEV